MEALKTEIDEEIVFEPDPDTDTDSDSDSDTDPTHFPTLLLTTPVSSVASSESSCVSSRDFLIETIENHNTAWSDTSSTISDAKKKNEKIEPEKKKKGRPRKEDAKNVKDAKKEKPKASKKPETQSLTENEELDFGITIDQINEHVNVTMNLDE